MRLKETLDPGTGEIWTTHNILANIATRQHRPNDARRHRKAARDARRAFPGTRHALLRHLPLIQACLSASGDASITAQLDTALSQITGNDNSALVTALRRVLAGERDADPLCAALNAECSLIIETLLAALVDPESLRPLLELAAQQAAESDPPQ